MFDTDDGTHLRLLWPFDVAALSPRSLGSPDVPPNVDELEEWAYIASQLGGGRTLFYRNPPAPHVEDSTTIPVKILLYGSVVAHRLTGLGSWNGCALLSSRR